MKFIRHGYAVLFRHFPVRQKYLLLQTRKQTVILKHLAIGSAILTKSNLVTGQNF